MKDCIILISHSNYRIKSAGVEKYLTDVTTLLAQQGIQCVHLFPLIEVNKRIVGLSREYVGININGVFEGVFSEKGLYNTLHLLKQKYSLDYIGVHLHHLHGWNLSLLAQTLEMLNIPIKIIIHDYEMICASMLKPDGCGPTCRKNIRRPDAVRCHGCKYAVVNIQRFKQINDFLNRINSFVESVIAPSEIAGSTWVGTYNKFSPKLVIREHLTPSSFQTSKYKPGRKIRIAYIGSTASHKGFEEWKLLIEHLPEEYELYYFGNSKQEQKNVRKVYVDFHDHAGASMTEQLKIYKIDIVFLWSTWLETYCYTAYEAYSAGCFLLTVNYSGNIAAMVQKNDCGRIFDILEQCSDYLNNSSLVRSELKEYRKINQIPDFIPNSSLDELLFLKNNQLKRPDITKELRGKHSRLLSWIYVMTRGKYNK